MLPLTLPEVYRERDHKVLRQDAVRIEKRIVLLGKASSVLGVEKPAEEEPSEHRFLQWVVRHPS